MPDIRIVDAGGAHEQVTVEIMRAQGFYQKVGIEPHKTYVTNGAEAVEKLMSGECEVAMQVGFGPALAAIADGAPMLIIAGANLLTVHALYTRQPDIRCLADLSGRSVGVGRLGALTHQLAVAAMIKHGTDPAKVNFVSIGNSASIFKALLRGEVDAGFGETDVYEHQGKYGVHVLEDAVLWKELPEFPNQASFATLDALENKRDKLVRILTAHALLYRFLHHPDSWPAFTKAWQKALPESSLDEGKVQWQFYQDNHPFAADLQLSRDHFDFMQQLNLRMNNQQQSIDYDQATDMSLRTEALDLLGQLSS